MVTESGINWQGPHPPPAWAMVATCSFGFVCSELWLERFWPDSLCLLCSVHLLKPRVLTAQERKEGSFLPGHGLFRKSTVSLPQPSQLCARSASSHRAGVCTQLLTHSEQQNQGAPRMPTEPVFLHGKGFGGFQGLGSSNGEVLAAEA